MERKYKDGDRVMVSGFYGVVVVDGIDDFLTKILGEIHYNGVTEDYLTRKRKTNNIDPFSEKDVIELLPAEK